MTLAHLQQDFLARIAAKEAPHKGMWANELAPGLAVYRHAYRSRLLDCLRESFDKTWTWLGDAGFDEVAKTYIETHQPVSWTLDVYGAYFPAFLTEYFDKDPEIGDLAWLEHAMQKSFASRNPTSITGADFTALTLEYGDDDWSTMRIIIQPDLLTRAVRTNCAEIWNHIEKKKIPPKSVEIDDDVRLLVWRQELTPCFRSFDPLEADALEKVKNGLRFGELCLSLTDDAKDDEENAAAATAVAMAGGYLVRWIDIGLVARLEK